MLKRVWKAQRVHSLPKSSWQLVEESGCGIPGFSGCQGPLIAQRDVASRNEDQAMPMAWLRFRTFTKNVFIGRTRVTQKSWGCCNSIVLALSRFCPPDTLHVRRPGNTDGADTPCITVLLTKKPLYNLVTAIIHDRPRWIPEMALKMAEGMAKKNGINFPS